MSSSQICIGFSAPSLLIGCNGSKKLRSYHHQPRISICPVSNHSNIHLRSHAPIKSHYLADVVAGMWWGSKSTCPGWVKNSTLTNEYIHDNLLETNWTTVHSTFEYFSYRVFRQHNTLSYLQTSNLKQPTCAVLRFYCIIFLTARWEHSAQDLYHLDSILIVRKRTSHQENPLSWWLFREKMLKTMLRMTDIRVRADCRRTISYSI